MNGLQVTYAIWLREVKLMVRERTRIVGMIGQPLLYLLVMGAGIGASMKFSGAADKTAYLTFMYPGVIGMSVLFTSIFSAMSIIWDREFGFLKEVLVAPAPRWAVAAGKVLGGATVATLQTAILLVFAPLAGVWPSGLASGVQMAVGLLLMSFLISCAMTSLGVAIASRMRSMQGFQMIMNFLIMPLYFLSGAIYPVPSTQGYEWMRALMVVNPLTYGVDALRNVVFWATGKEGAGLLLFHPLVDVGVMAATAVVLALFAAWRFSAAE
jgi:ABC-2 type transport system permease protein